MDTKANPKHNVPVLMFHSVGLEDHDWVWSYISEPVDLFESKIAALKRYGYNAVTWSDVYQHMAGEMLLPPNSILLTFDDGYLDNWVFVYPILRKYDMRGTIFVSPDFVDPTTELRPTIDDIGADAKADGNLKLAGFLNWAEMRAMEQSGVIDIQSHAMTHTWYFSGPKIVDFVNRRSVWRNPWLAWNKYPHRKPFYLSDPVTDALPPGYPIFEHTKSLVARQFFPDEDAVSEVVSFAASAGGHEFLAQEHATDALRNFVSERFGAHSFPGRYESDHEKRDRIRHELCGSKQRIESELSKKCDFICWPGGANDALVHEIAAEVGYKSWTLDSRSDLGKKNRPGEDPGTIKRIGTANSIVVKGRNCGNGGAYFQMLRIRAHQGYLGARLQLKALKAACLLKSSVS